MTERKFVVSRRVVHAASGASVLAMALALSAAPLAAQDRPSCDEALVPQPEECRRANSDVVVLMPTGENAELIDSYPAAGLAGEGFSISIDGSPVAGGPPPRDGKRQSDIAAAAADVDVRFDGLVSQPMLNVATRDLRGAFRAGERVTFSAFTNYPAYVARAEIRIIDRKARGRPVVATIPTAPNGLAEWTMPAEGPSELAYVLRVYDAAGRYDETMPLSLTRSDKATETHATTGMVVAAGTGEDRSRTRNILVHGGQITVSGRGIAGGTVSVMGETVPVDATGSFVTSRILPAGRHQVTVSADGRDIVRDVEIVPSQWFYVGIIDLTAGKRLRDDLASADPAYKSTYVDGRLAFYAKGRTQRGYQITGSVDTGEGDISDLFSRLDQKDPRKVIQRLGPNDVYPTYGDDSSAYDDAPTSGRFYLKVERDRSSLTWGDFKANVDGAELLRNVRSLYGAELRYASRSVTDKGEAKGKVTLYAAQPDTLPQRDILRGTGGSVYFLSRQDINGASENLTIETVDPVTGRVVQRQTLVAGTDYQIDYIQGVVTLSRPLSSSSSGGAVISSGAAGAYDNNLVAQYEYTPTAGSLDGASAGGRAEVWAGDRLRLGVTAMTETTGSASQRMAGADLRYELGTLSYVEAEVAQSTGPGFGRSISTDGGLTIAASGSTVSKRALAWRLDSQLDLAELGATKPGKLGFYAEKKGAGFSTLTEDITQDQWLVGMTSTIELTPSLSFGLDAERFDKAGGDGKTSAELRLAYRLDDRWTVTGAVGFLDQTKLADPRETGKRTDLAVRLDYKAGDDLSLYGFGQATANVSGGIGRNDRLGLGFDAALSEKVKVAGEISGGSKGAGARARLSYAPTADDEVYLGYTLDPTRTGAGYQLVGQDEGTIVVGGRWKQSDAVSIFQENNWDLFGNRHSLTRTFGVTYTPDARWTYSGAVETGKVRDAANGDFDRTALSFGLAYADDDRETGRVRLEYRTEDGNGLAQDRKTWAVSAGYEDRINDNWRFIATLDGLYSDSNASNFLDGQYLEGSLGYAYRPTDNDRLNVLMRYTYLRDLPGADQVTASGSQNGPLQVSQVASIDANYDLTPKLTIGGKFGFRAGKTAPRATRVFTNSTAQLAILRLDWHVVHAWDALAEVRLLRTEGVSTDESGGMLALYRHFGNNAKIGLGYEFGKVSDDVTAIDYSAKGVFLNVVGKF